ncbi:hypothetical protein [Variovorax sp.]|jgi:hypothetical protein|uniref:hypothetical protein n=1 Tax=Variovorax sp. TaxID=1871043 RepID=UPI0037D9B277
MAVAQKNWIADGGGHKEASLATWTVLVSLLVVVVTMACLYLAVQRERAAVAQAPASAVSMQTQPEEISLASMPVGLAK